MGAGQLINRQYGKAVLFFAVLICAITLELTTGSYPAPESGFIYRTNGGFFIRGIWGLITLGTETQKVTIGGLTAGDNSIELLANGLIAVLVLSLFAGLWIWSVLDANAVAAGSDANKERETSREYVSRVAKSAYPFLILSPMLILILFITVLPIIFGISIAFTNYDRNHLPPSTLVEWVGLANFRRVIGIAVWARTFVGVFGWTIIWAIAATATTYLFGFLQASILASKRVRWPKLWRSIYILPWAVPAMVSALVFRSMFNGQFGPISQFLLDLGISSARINWLTDSNNPNLARIVALLVNLWLGFPFFMALIGSALTSIDGSYYEAARIDGASSFQLFRHITFPIIARITSPLIILAIVANFNNFGVIYFLTGGGPANPNYQFAGSTDLLITWLFKLTLDNRLYDVGAVMSLVIFVIVGSFSIWGLRRSRVLEES